MFLKAMKSIFGQQLHDAPLGYSTPGKRLGIPDEYMMGFRPMTTTQRQAADERLALRKLKEKRLLTAITFMASGLERLVEEQQTKLAGLSPCPTSNDLKLVETYIATGQRALLGQADLLFGKRTVDDALKQCGHEPITFRINIQIDSRQ